MHVQTFAERASTLENRFFAEVDKELLKRIRDELAEQEAIASLRAASGISDEQLLSELVHIEVQPETLAAVSLIPLVVAAWASGEVAEDQRKKILAVEREAGITENSPSDRLLNHWLVVHPVNPAGLQFLR